MTNPANPADPVLFGLLKALDDESFEAAKRCADRQIGEYFDNPEDAVANSVPPSDEERYGKALEDILKPFLAGVWEAGQNADARDPNPYAPQA
jgi:hypothetical protein